MCGAMDLQAVASLVEEEGDVVLPAGRVALNHRAQVGCNRLADLLIGMERLGDQPVQQARFRLGAAQAHGNLLPNDGPPVVHETRPSAQRKVCDLPCGRPRR
jgi:hypothetical protein